MRRALLITICLLMTGGAARAQQGSRGFEDRRIVTAMRLGGSEQVDLDGVLNEPVWERAVPADGFMQIESDNGQPATERTEVRIVFDSDRMILGSRFGPPDSRPKDDGGDLPGEDFTVFRTRRRFFQQSHLGVIFFVYNHNWQNDPAGIFTNSRSAVSKVVFNTQILRGLAAFGSRNGLRTKKAARLGRH